MKKPLLVTDAGRTDYREMWERQREIQQALIEQKRRRSPGRSPSQSPDGRSPGRSNGQSPDGQHIATESHGKQTLQELPDTTLPDQLLLVEHPHVYTLGKSGDKAHLLKGLAELAAIDAEFVEIDRGGDITYHGPGQLVAYPILDLDRHFTDIHKYLRELEEVVILVCAEYGITAGRIEGLTGVWIGDQKICAFGIRSSRWVTMHGLALNVNSDLSYFGHIIPCGIEDKQVTSLQALLGREVSIAEVKEHLVRHFCERFDMRAIYADPSA